MHFFDQHAKELEKQLFLQKIRKSLGKELLILFIEYLERFVTNEPYANLLELLIPQGFTHKEAEELSEVLYTEKKLSKHLETKIAEILTKIDKK